MQHFEQLNNCQLLKKVSDPWSQYRTNCLSVQDMPSGVQFQRKFNFKLRGDNTKSPRLSSIIFGDKEENIFSYLKGTALTLT